MFSLRQVIYRKLVYPLLTTQFSLEQCQAIMSPILARGLLALGVVQSFLCALAHGLLSYGSLDPNLHMEQTIVQIQQVLSLAEMSNTTAFLLHTCSKYMQLEVGMLGDLFYIPTLLADSIMNSWIKHIWMTLN